MPTSNRAVPRRSIEPSTSSAITRATTCSNSRSTARVERRSRNQIADRSVRNAPGERGIDGIVAEALAYEVFEVGRLGELVAAFDTDALTGDPCGLRSCEVTDARGDVVRHAGTAERL